MTTSKDPELRDRLAGLAAFLGVLQAPDFSFGTWSGGNKTPSGAIEMPYFNTSDEASRLIKTAYDLGWVLEDFNWPSWKDTDEAKRLLEPSALGQATYDDLTHLLTTLIRQDRFVEGNLNWAFESGLLIGILERADQLLSELSSASPAKKK